MILFYRGTGDQTQTLIHARQTFFLSYPPKGNEYSTVCSVFGGNYHASFFKLGISPKDCRPLGLRLGPSKGQVITRIQILSFLFLLSSLPAFLLSSAHLTYERPCVSCQHGKGLEWGWGQETSVLAATVGQWSFMGFSFYITFGYNSMWHHLQGQVMYCSKDLVEELRVEKTCCIPFMPGDRMLLLTRC